MLSFKHPKKRYFGTDGIRGRTGSPLIHPEFVLKLGWAIGTIMNHGQHGGKALIGKDTRISGYMFESALEAGLSAAGMDIYLAGPIPTPAIAYLTRTLRAQVGIVISASHNPYYDNGIKLFSSSGTKLDDSFEHAIEQKLQEPLSVTHLQHLGKASRLIDAKGRYIEFCKTIVPSTLSLRGTRIILDCAHGAAYQTAPAVLKELGAHVIEIGTQPDGMNINAQCGSTQPDQLRELVINHRADLGIALDGDGDRVIMVDHLGHIVDGDDILYIIARFNQQQNTLHGGVVGTAMSNLGLERALKDLGIAFKRTDIGDRHVYHTLQQQNWQLGGEPSGHIMHLPKTSTGDGTVTALQILAIMHTTDRSLHDLRAQYQKTAQILINVPITKNIPPHDRKRLDHAIAILSKELNDQGLIVLRESGTEPVMRIMVQGYQTQKVEKIAKDLQDMVMEACQ